jgi:uncharacterized membrane-anchored protein
MTRRTAAFVALVAAMAMLPLLLIAWNEVQLARGQKVLLRTEPIDPVDLVRGRYVRLRYEISALSAPAGETVYVPLHEEGDAWTGSFATTDRPESGVFIRGRATDGGIVYGIETYYADEAEARRLEREAGDGLHVRVSLADDGKARIEGVEVR